MRPPLRLLLLVLLLLLLALPVTAAEIALAPPVEGETLGAQSVDSGASNGIDYLFVWGDRRGSAITPPRRAARVTRDGVVLDRGGIALPFLWETNSVVWTGTSYLIVWNEQSAIRGVRIDAEGKIVDGPRVLKAGAWLHSVANAGPHVVLAYQLKPGNEKRALFLDSEARIAADVFLDDPSFDEMSIACSRTHCAAIWKDSNSTTPPLSWLEGVRFDVTGRLDASPRKLLPDGMYFSSKPAIASDGDTFLMVTKRGIDAVFARRLGADLDLIGAPLPLPKPYYESLGRFGYSNPLLWNGSNYLIFDDDRRSITATRLERDGLFAGSTTIESDVSLMSAVPVVNGSDMLVGWTSFLHPEFEAEAFGTLLTGPTLERRSRTLLSVGPVEQRWPSIASGGTNLLAVWREGVEIHARRLAPDGTFLDAVPLRLSTNGIPAEVVFNGSDYLVVWADIMQTWTGTVVTRIPRDGPLRVDGQTVLPKASPATAVSDGVTTLLFWWGSGELHAGRILADSSIDGDIVVIADGALTGMAAAAGDGAFLVAWETRTFFSPPANYDYQIHGTRVSPELTRLDTPFDLSPADPTQKDPGVAWNGREWLVTWISSSSELRGRRVSRDGVPQGETSGTFIASRAAAPSVTWDGNRYFLAWHESRVAGPTTIHTAFLSGLGQPLAGESQIPQKLFDWGALSIAPLRPGLVAAAYTRLISFGAYDEARLAFVNLVSPAIPKRRSAR